MDKLKNFKAAESILLSFQRFYFEFKKAPIYAAFSGCGLMLAAVSAGVPIVLLERLNKGEMPVQTFSLIMILGFGIFYSVPLIITAIVCQERLPIPEEKLKFSFANFIKPLKLRAFVYLLLIFVTFQKNF